MRSSIWKFDQVLFFNRHRDSPQSKLRVKLLWTSFHYYTPYNLTLHKNNCVELLSWSFWTFILKRLLHFPRFFSSSFHPFHSSAFSIAPQITTDSFFCFHFKKCLRCLLPFPTFFHAIILLTLWTIFLVLAMRPSDFRFSIFSRRMASFCGFFTFRWIHKLLLSSITESSFGGPAKGSLGLQAASTRPFSLSLRYASLHAAFG